MTSCCRSQSCSVVSSSGLEIDRPALLTTRSTPPKASAPSATAAGDLLLVGHVDGHGYGDVRAADLRGDLRGGLAVEVGDHDAGAFGASRWAMARPMPEPAPVTSATRAASGLGVGIRWSLGSSSAQYSMRNFSRSSIGA